MKMASEVIRHALANNGIIAHTDFRCIWSSDYSRQPVGPTKVPLGRILADAFRLSTDVKIPVESLQEAFPDIKIVPPMHNAPIKSELFDGTLNGYQAAAQTTAIYPGKGTFLGLMYTALKGGGEAGEFGEKVGKLMRDDNMGPYQRNSDISIDARNALILEIGDELWYLAAKCQELGITLEDAAHRNIKKLQARQQSGTLHGSGDNR